MTARHRIAVLSDIHGNRWALEAVLDQIDSLGADTILSLGDCVYGPLDPLVTLQILMDREVLSVRGNEDRILTDSAARESPSPIVRRIRERLAPGHLEWLSALPPTRILEGDLFLCHGTPGDDTEYLLTEAGPSGLRPRSWRAVQERVATVHAGIVLCGHDHLQGTLRLPSGVTVVNPGSVGLPAFADDVPCDHVAEAGTPHARYAVLSRTATGWDVQQEAAEYDWESAARAAEANGRPDWARWLRTGRAA